MKITAGIIGSGIGLKHLEAINQSKNSFVKYICETNPKKIKELKEKFPKIKVTKNENELFHDKNVNLISIASYDNFHYNQILKSLKYNKNIIAEKPICLNISELKNIKKIFIKKKDLFFTSNLVLRENSLFKLIKKKINKNEVFYIEADYIWGRPHKLLQWRSKVKNYSITLGAAIHMIDLVNWLLEKKPIYVTSFGNNRAYKNSNFKKYSHAIYILEYKDDLKVKITANGASIYQHTHEVKIFEKNKTLVNAFGRKFYFTKNKNSSVINNFKNANYPDKKNRKNLIINFIKNIHKKVKKNNLKLFQEQVDLMSICFSCDKSLRKNKRFKIKYF